MTSDVRDLDRLLADLPVGAAPVDELLREGHASRRRRRLATVGGTVLGVVAAVAGAAALSAVPGAEDGPTYAGPAPTYSLRVQTEEAGRPFYYEGALPEVEVGDADGHAIRPDSRSDSPTLTGGTWSGLAEGRYVVEGALRPCLGDCDHLDGPADSCRLDVVLDRDLVARVRLVGGQPCTITTYEDTYPDGDLRVERVPEPESLVGTWWLTLVREDGAVVPVWQGDHLQMRLFRHDGKYVAGWDDGVNDHGLTWSLGEDGAYRVSEAAQTLVGCASEPCGDPAAGTGVQEATWLRLGPRGELLYLDADGRLLAAYERVPDLDAAERQARERRR